MWSRKFDRCQRCGRTKYEHHAKGLCKSCYDYPWKKRSLYKRRDRDRLQYKKLKLTLSCLICGENHPACLDFHHKDQSMKEERVSKILSEKNFNEVLKEIKKCDVLCANCHRKLHYPK